VVAALKSIAPPETNRLARILLAMLRLTDVLPAYNVNRRFKCCARATRPRIRKRRSGDAREFVVRNRFKLNLLLFELKHVRESLLAHTMQIRSVCPTCTCIGLAGKGRSARDGRRRRPSLFVVHPTTTRNVAVLNNNDDNDVELAVFRFTLGIPGFDDALIPRVVGVVGITLLLLNHALSGEAGSSQAVTETIGIVLSGVGIAAPTLQKRIEDLAPGKGRRPALENLEGAANAFAISEALSEDQKQEAAWASFAVIKNANVCGMFLTVNGSPVMCRGALGAGIGGDDCLEKARVAWAQTGMGANESCYYETRDRIDASPLKQCAIVPSGTGSVAVLPVKPLDDGASGGGGTSVGTMVLMCDRERAMSPKEMAWCQAVCSKLHCILNE